MNEPLTNWAGNIVFDPARFHRPATVPDLQRIVAGADRVRALGTGHSFNRIADTDGDLVSVAGLPLSIELDPEARTVTVAAGATYGQLGRYLQERGYAIPNTGSLPHISVAGACSTGTHGSGVGNRNLPAGVCAVELVTATGDLLRLDRTDPRFPGAVLSLGSLGIMTRLTLDVVPTFDVRQHVYDDLPRAAFDDHLAEILAAAYSVSAFLDWKRPVVDQVWLKHLLDPRTAAPDPSPHLFGGRLATAPRHPVAGMPASQATQQLGVAGPWNERLPHFRLEFVPSSGDELQSEYLLPREHALAALHALDSVAGLMTPVLQVAEIRTVAADDLWLSPCYQHDLVAFHFTWLPDQAAVDPVLAAIEDRLAGFAARPHWGKIFTTPPEVIRALYPRLPDFQTLRHTLDPTTKFTNDLVDLYLGN